MIPLTIENVYSEYYSTFQGGADFMIGFYENHLLFFKNIKPLKDKEELKMFIELIGRYVDALYTKGRYAIAVNAVDIYLPYIDKEIQKLNADEAKNTWYYQLDFIKGMSSYNLRNYKTSASIFKKLVLSDNWNDQYKNWLTSSRHAQWALFMRIIAVSCLLLMGIVLIFDNYISPHIGMPVIKIVFPILILVTLYEYFPHLFFHNKRKK